MKSRIYILRLTYEELSLISRILTRVRDSNGFITDQAFKILKKIAKEIK